MKGLLLFCGTNLLLLGSATPPNAGADGPAAPYPQLAAAAPLLVAEPLPALDPDPVAPPRPEPKPEPPAEPVAAVAEAADPSEEPAPPPPGSPSGVRIVVSLPQQKAWVFDDGALVDTTRVSTGKRGHETPAGTFRILQKKVHHRSNKYANAPMPYMQRLTWYGIALHAGPLPGYPASHGCIRLPRSFAKKLYGLTDYGTQVTITKRRVKSASEALTLA